MHIPQAPRSSESGPATPRPRLAVAGPAAGLAAPAPPRLVVIAGGLSLPPPPAGWEPPEAA